MLLPQETPERGWLTHPRALGLGPLSSQDQSGGPSLTRWKWGPTAFPARWEVWSRCREASSGGLVPPEVEPGKTGHVLRALTAD